MSNADVQQREHAWVENVVVPARWNDRGFLIPACTFFPKCERCGCLVTEQAKTLLFRATPSAAWTTTEPACPEAP